MKLEEAIKILSPFPFLKERGSLWLDLGCGDGLFTRALAYYLQPGSEIIGIDQHIEKGTRISENEVRIEFQQAKIDMEFLWNSKVDGILMANFLHYIEDQNSFINRLEKLMKDSVKFIIVEYDRSISNNWVPYPISINNLHSLFSNKDAAIKILGKRKSRFGSAMLYSAAIKYKK